MTVSGRAILLELELLLLAPLGIVAVRLALGRWPFQMVALPSEVDPEMLQIAAWSDELLGVDEARGSCEL